MIGRIEVVAHRGGAGLAPENTVAAFENAIRAGADYVEIDVRSTCDGRLVLMHDRTVDRTTNGSGAVKDLDFETIRGLDAGSTFGPAFAGERVATLEEALAVCKGRASIYLDHKAAPVTQVFESVRLARMETDILVYGEVSTLAEWKRIAPDVPVMPTLPRDLRRAGGVAEYHNLIAASILDGAIQYWTRELVDEAHNVGIRVFLDCLGEFDNVEAYRKAFDIGVDGAQTDYPDRLRSFLLEVGREQ